MIRLTMAKKLCKVLNNPTYFGKMDDLTMATQNIVIGEYQKEAPVDKGTLRRSVSLKISPMSAQGKGYVVGAYARARNGVPYATYLVEGTGKNKGDKDWGYTTGYTRAGIKHKGGSVPNWFPKRAEVTAKPKVIKFFTQELAKLINE